MQAMLLRARRFAPLFWTQFLGAFNDNFFKNALVILVAFQGIRVAGIPPELLVPLAGGIFILPYFLFSATAGQIADATDKARVIRLTKLAEIAIMALAAYGFAAGKPGLLLVVLFLMGSQSAFFGPCKYGILPQHLDEEELVAGNALVEMGTYLAILLGTLAGGELIARPVDGTWLVACGVVAVAALGALASLGVPPAPPLSDAPERVDWTLVGPTRRILALTAKNRTILNAILGISWFWLFGAAFLSLFPTWTRATLDGTERLATLFLALFSIGIGVGSSICDKLSRERVEIGLVPLGSFGMSLFTADLWWLGDPWDRAPGSVDVAAFFASPTGWRIAFDLVGLAVFGGFLIVPLYALIQLRAEPDERSRVIAGNNIWNALFMVASAGVLAALAALGMSAPAIFGLLAVANLAVAVYIYTVVPEFLLRFLVYLLSLVTYRVKAVGLSNIPREGPAVLVCNHVSFIDWFILAGAVKRPIRFVMYKGIYDLPVMRFLFRQAGVIPIAGRSEDPACFERAFEQIHEALQQGWLVGIFPEGALTGDGEIQPFKKGVEHIVRRDPVPVVPMALNGLWGSFFSRIEGKGMKKPFRRGLWSRVWLHVLPPVPPERVTAAGLEAQVRAQWEKMPDHP